MVLEAGGAVGVTDRVMQPSGQLERNAGIEGRQDAVGEVVLARERLSGGAAGAELGDDRSAVDAALADLGQQVFDEVELGWLDREPGRRFGHVGVRGPTCSSATTLTPSAPSVGRRWSPITTTSIGCGSLDAAARGTRPSRRPGPGADRSKSASGSVRQARCALSAPRRTASSAGGNIAASSRRSWNKRGLERCWAKRRLTPQHRTATLVAEIDTGMSDQRTHSASSARPHGGRTDGALPIDGVHPAEAAYPAPAAERRTRVRGADGRGGLLVGLVAALPPQPAVADRRRGRLAGRRPLDHDPTTRSSRST